jgi:hypothetical protein
MVLAEHVSLIALGLFVAMLLLLEAGRRWGIRRRRQDPESIGGGQGAVEGAVYGLLGLLIAFTFSAAAARFEARRALVVQEANTIGTAWLRLDLLPAEAQPPLRDLFRRYLDSRLAFYRKLPDLPAATVELGRSAGFQGEIWTQAVTACRELGNPAVTLLVLPALNEMIDITTTRTWAARNHSPLIIFVTLGMFALAGSLLAGFAMSEGKGRSWLHVIGFAALMAATLYVIVDFEYPRIGLIRLDEGDQVLVDLRQSMN